MFKKLLSVILSVIIVMGMGVKTFAMDPSGQIQPYTIPPETIKWLEGIPIYITYIYTSVNIDKQQAAKYDASEQRINSEVKKLLTGNSIVISNEYAIVHISNEEKNKIISNPIFAGTFKAVKDLSDRGTPVNDLNIFLPERSVSTIENVFIADSYNMNDPEYWEAICGPFGKYKDYKFSYLEPSIAIADTLSGNPKLDILIRKTLTHFVTPYNMKGMFYETIKESINALSGLLYFYEPELNISHKPSTDMLDQFINSLLKIE